MKNDWPELTQQPIQHIDATPDEDYALRILRAYRENCNVMWSVSSDKDLENPLFEMMNQHNIDRAKILDKAIELLQANKGK